MSDLITASPRLEEFPIDTTPLLTVGAVLGLTIILGLLFPSTLAGKTFTLLGLTMAGAVVGAWHGRRLRGLKMWIAFGGGFVGMFVISMVAEKLILPVLILAMIGWGWLEGVFIGPILASYVQVLGAETVSSAFAITTMVMAGCAAVADLMGVNAIGLGRYLGFGLLALIVVGVIGIFRGFSEKVSRVYALIGMAIFTGFFLFDFSRLNAMQKASIDTWGAAARMAISIYLDFVNFFLMLLQLLAHSHRR